MSTVVHVGNISFSASEEDIRAFFQGLVVSSVSLALDKATGRSKGHAHVTLASLEDAEKALAFSGKPLKGRPVNISTAPERKQAFQSASQLQAQAQRQQQLLASQHKQAPEEKKIAFQPPPPQQQQAPPQQAPPQQPQQPKQQQPQQQQQPRQQQQQQVQQQQRPERQDRQERQPYQQQQQQQQRPRQEREQPVDKSQPSWWVCARKPEPIPEDGASLKPVFVVEAPAGISTLAFYKKEFGNYPAESERDLQYGNFVTCVVGPASPARAPTAPKDVTNELTINLIQPFLSQASEYGAGSTALFTLCESGYIVPKRIAEETFTIDELNDMLQDGTIRHFFVEELPKEITRENVSACMSHDSKWEHKFTDIQIDATFCDQKVAYFSISEDGGVQADHDAAQAASSQDGGAKVAAGADLDSRAALCSMGPGGRLVLPPVTTSDIRVMGARKLDAQANRKVETYEHLTSWSATVATVAAYDHADKYQRPDSKHYEITVFRRHLLPETSGLDEGGGEEYPVLKVIYLRLGRCVDVAVTLFEIAPVTDAEGNLIEPVKSADISDILVVFLEGLGLARTLTNALPAQRLPRVEEGVSLAERAKLETKAAFRR